MTKQISTKPVGATSYHETSFGIIPRSKLLNLELEGAKRGLEFIHKLSSDKPEITPEIILEIHRISFGWIFPRWAGKYRTIRVEFSGKEAVSPHQIPELMSNLCSDLKERLKYLSSQDSDFTTQLITVVAWVQHRFVWIHPFQDYNGRVARMLTILTLLNFGLPPVEIRADVGSDRKKYLEAMYAADEGNYTKLEKLISKALSESLSVMEKTT